jgi:hypothetical protein
MTPSIRITGWLDGQVKNTTTVHAEQLDALSFSWIRAGGHSENNPNNRFAGIINHMLIAAGADAGDPQRESGDPGFSMTARGTTPVLPVIAFWPARNGPPVQRVV